ncbi:twin-arginine translocase TatA/TatE family subunit [Leucobacter triazinivorans]|uniref:Sec-independent protein translocase protein TatA n=1 Tax=Leucobacter triazinivorans TaxID=1784719 RepID=A0A4P6KEM0_9MICO|nr:twin-arginine translocase TatA/TatE family subunit [Leucobacter triazinivorans]QBE48570.1 twin-arginine translocase TatA/TatE family subunit [Leucobacter triazinivorans]
MIGNLSGPTLLVILFIVLLLFGAPKLPGLAKSLGQSMRILKKEVRSDSEDSATANGGAAAPQAPPAAPRESTAGSTPSTPPAVPREETAGQTPPAVPREEASGATPQSPPAAPRDGSGEDDSNQPRA